ncbi:MAG: DNA polymerase Y family protein [Bacteroidota bacterium]
MEPILLHLAIDSFAIQAERLRCPKLAGRPVALAQPDSSRPRVLAASREALAAGVGPGVSLLAARRLCRDLVALPPDTDLYAGLSDSIRDRLLPFAPLGGTPRPGRFVLDLTGLARTHADACRRAARMGAEVERAFALHPTLGIGATRLVSAVAAGVLAPDGELLDVPAGSETGFLAPLAVRVLPSARGRLEAERLDLLTVRFVRDVQALALNQLEAAVGRHAATSLWRESRGLDGAPARAAERLPAAVLEETLPAETNDRRVLGARMARLAMELGVAIRRRGAAASRLEAGVVYADGRAYRASRVLVSPLAAERALRAAADALLDRALARRVRVRRIRLAAWEDAARGEQLALWPGAAAEPVAGSGARIDGQAHDRARAAVTRAAAFDAALDRLRARLGTDALVPASWMALGVALRPPARP